MLRFSWLILAALLLAACGPLLPSATEQPLSTPQVSLPASATIRLTKSGGIAGVMQTLEIKADGQATVTDERAGKTVSLKLTPAQLGRLQKLATETQFKAPDGPSGCADCFIYTVEIDSGSGKPAVFEADDVSLADSGISDMVDFLSTIMEDALR